MNVSSVKLVYFSPTRTTQKILEGIAQGTGIGPVEHLDALGGCFREGGCVPGQYRAPVVSVVNHCCAEVILAGVFGSLHSPLDGQLGIEESRWGRPFYSPVRIDVLG